MDNASSPKTGEQKPGDDSSASDFEIQPIPSFALAASEQSSDEHARKLAPTSASQKSFWAKARESLNEVSTQASSTGGVLASKAIKLGVSAAAKSAEIAKQTHSASGSATRAALEASKQAYAGSKLESTVNYLDTELDQRGAKQALKGTTEAVIGKIDQVTGKRLVELLEKKLAFQDAYNDILATRLAEALERIAKLETKFSNFVAKSSGSAIGSTSTSDTREM